MDTDLRPDTSIDPLVQHQMQERLARLAERRTGGAAGSNHSNQSNQSNGSQRTTAQKPSTGRKRHAAQGSRTAAVMMSVGVAAGLTGYFQRADAAAAAEAAAASSATASVAVASSTDTASTDSASTDTASTDTASTDTAATTATDTAAATQVLETSTAANDAAATVSTTGLADGTYTGATDTNKWGPVQVQITVSGGVITEVVALQTPDDDGKSVRINDEAVPILVSETLAAQNADIDSVSGATYTSDSYKVSLQSAIDLAKATAQQAAA